MFAELSRKVEEEAAAKGKIAEIANPWEKYKFDLPSPVSRRLDVLLGARQSERSSATNGNLIRCTHNVVAVLDWWVGNPQSPAYAVENPPLYRVSEKDGGPVFSVPLRNDQNQLFTEGVRRAIEARKQAKRST